MHRTRSIVHVLPVLLAVVTSGAHAQSRATCQFIEEFSGAGLPAGWTMVPDQVERLDADGIGTGEFTTPWIVGNAAQADAAGYFPVPDQPQGNTFAMANDDASPCDCAMEDVTLVSPPIDLVGITNPALSYRVYHDGRPFNGRAWVEASPDGVSWTTLEEVPPLFGVWQQRLIDLAAFGTGSAQVRFRYDDAGNWSSGLAVDDICVFDRLNHDIAFTDAWLGDATVSAFNTSARSLGYSMIPAEQQTPLLLSARIRNNGLSVATAVRVQASISVNGGAPDVSTVILLDSLLPLQDILVTWNTGFISGDPGSVGVNLLLEEDAPDEETLDNMAALSYHVTSPSEGGNAMALDNDLAGTVTGTDEGFSIGCRYELEGNTSAVHGISVRFGTGTLVGSVVNALLMDGDLNLLSGSTGHPITEEDLSLCFTGGTVYLPLDSIVTIAAPQDVYALVRCLPDSGAMRVGCGGIVPQGAAVLVEASGFVLSYPTTAPIVRIHFSEPETGISPVGSAASSVMTISPNPAIGSTTVHISSADPEPLTLRVINAEGRIVFNDRWTVRSSPYQLDVNGWTSGIYEVLVQGRVVQAHTRLIVR